MIYPRIYFNSVTEIKLDYLKENKIKGLILDVDNTLIDFDRNLSKEVVDWCSDLKSNGIKICILSNTNKLDKVEKVAKILDLEFIYFAKKPFKKGFKQAAELLSLSANSIGVVGDQIFTDIIGANRSKMFPILVKPIDERDLFVTRIKRPIENLIIRSFLKKTRRGN